MFLKVSGKAGDDGADMVAQVQHFVYRDEGGIWRVRLMESDAIEAWEKQLAVLRDRDSGDRTHSTAKAKPRDDEAVAATKLKMANGLRDKNPDAARRRLREITENYPTTAAAKEAKRILDEMANE